MIIVMKMGVQKKMRTKFELTKSKQAVKTLMPFVVFAENLHVCNLGRFKILS